MSNTKTERAYHSFDPELGYPSGEDLFYECQICKAVVPSQPPVDTRCICGNIMIDMSFGRMGVADPKQARLFSLRDVQGL